MKIKLLIISVLVVLCAACGSKQSEGLTEAHSVSAKAEMSMADGAEMRQENGAQPSREAGGSSVAVIPDAVNKKLIKDGNMRIKTNDIEASKKQLDGLLKEFQGYFESENLENDDQSTRYNLRVRLPAQRFEGFIVALETGDDEVESKYVQTRDVTEEYIDVVTRLKNERAYMVRYQALLAKASTVKDILSIEESIRKLQEEIESREGRLKYLNDQIAFSTLNIELYKEKPYKYASRQKDPFGERVKKSLSNGWSFIVGLALLLVAMWPLWLIGAGVVVLVRRVRKRQKEKL
jgi:hypothetical protein